MEVTRGLARRDRRGIMQSHLRSYGYCIRDAVSDDPRTWSGNIRGCCTIRAQHGDGGSTCRRFGGNNPCGREFMERMLSPSRPGRRAQRKVQLLLWVADKWRRLHGQRQDVCVCGVADRVLYQAA